MPNAFTPEEWSRIEAILDEVLELEPGARAGALDRACPGDAFLRAHVERLIAADTDAARFLETPAMVYAAGLVNAAATEIQADDRDKPGDRIGPYRLIREIGRGGMGRVFLADRADGQFEQLVALKLVRGAPYGGEIHGRFLRERQILARLQHPNIARLLDGGVAVDGRPYFAMEYVAGEPITTYCDGKSLDVRHRLALFAAVCDAVQYAHQNLVVHRDLKPSNTLVAAEGQVKLLDFGIAKVLQDEQDELTGHAGEPLTRLGSGPMTPEYAAPEQVRGEAVTTATDVYALGALAYELLTGRGPHRLSSLTAAEVERAVTERDIARPSSAVSRGTPGKDGEIAPDVIARARGTDRHRPAAPAARRPRHYRHDGAAEGSRAALRVRGGVCRGRPQIPKRPAHRRAAGFGRVSHEQVRGTPCHRCDRDGAGAAVSHRRAHRDGVAGKGRVPGSGQGAGNQPVSLEPLRGRRSRTDQRRRCHRARSPRPRCQEDRDRARRSAGRPGRHDAARGPHLPGPRRL